MNAEHFEYAVGDHVKIIDIGLNGTIVARVDRGRGVHEFRVIFWSNSERKDEWLMPFEIERIEEKP